ncbi:MAG: hexameric tyrosine-coordinated heme protein [Hyphomicrobiaceae bacterium]
MPDDHIAPTLKTATPEEGYAPAVKMGRVAIKMTQPNTEVRVVATHFATVPPANNYWSHAT